MIKLHNDTEEKLNFDLENNRFLQWAYMLKVTAGAGKIDQDNTKDIISKVKDRLIGILQNYINPFRKQEEKEERQEITEEQKTNFLEEMGKYKFSGISEIINTIKEKTQ